MKKSVEILKSQATKEQIEKLLELYEGSNQARKVYREFIPETEIELMQLILFLDPTLNKKIIKKGGWYFQVSKYFGVMKWDHECGYHYVPDKKDCITYDSRYDHNYCPDLCDNYDKLSNKVIDRLIGHSKKLKKILTILNS